MHLNNINYLIKDGELKSLRFDIHKASDLDVKKIEEILDFHLKRGWRSILTNKKRETYKEGFLKRKIENIFYLKRKFLKPGDYALITLNKLNNEIPNYISFKSKKILKGNHISLYIDFPRNRGFRILENIIQELKPNLPTDISKIYNKLKDFLDYS